MIPIINIIGKSNVGKSTLYNKLGLCKKNLVSKLIGLTKERNYYLSSINNFNYFLIDNPGFLIKNNDLYNIKLNINISIEECDIIILMFDIFLNINYNDFLVFNYIKKKHKYIFVFINKIDIDKEFNYNLYIKLKIGKPYFLSCIHNYNVEKSILNILNIFCLNKKCFKKKIKKNFFKISIIGKYNVGKSSLLNKLLKKDSITIYNKSNTTQDSNVFNFKYKNQIYQILDTIGFYKKNLISIKNFKNILIIKNIQLIINSNIIIFLLSNEFLKIDIKIYFLIKNENLPIFFIINKLDLFNDIINKIYYKIYIKKKLKLFNFYYIIFISIKNDININYIKIILNKIYLNLIIKLSTNKLNKISKKMEKFFINKNFIKKIMLHQGGKNPPLIIIHKFENYKIKKYYLKLLKFYIFKFFFLKSVNIKIKLV